MNVMDGEIVLKIHNYQNLFDYGNIENLLNDKGDCHERRQNIK